LRGPVARGVDINTVTAESNFVVQLYEAAGSEISVKLQLASSHTNQELVVAADVNIHPDAATAERNFVVKLYEAAGSEISLELQLASSHTHQELVVAADIDIHPVAAAERNFLV
jgi:hypothetical protein